MLSFRPSLCFQGENSLIQSLDYNVKIMHYRYRGIFPGLTLPTSHVTSLLRIWFPRQHLNRSYCFLFSSFYNQQRCRMQQYVVKQLINYYRCKLLFTRCGNSAVALHYQRLMTGLLCCYSVVGVGCYVAATVAL